LIFGLGARRSNAARARKRVQLRGGARRQPARRTQDGRAAAGGEASGYGSPGERERAALSRLSRAPTKQMGPYRRSSGLSRSVKENFVSTTWPSTERTR